jgi:hypothetical protein
MLIFSHLIRVLKWSFSYEEIDPFCIRNIFWLLELLFLNFKHAWYYNCTENVGRNWSRRRDSTGWNTFCVCKLWPWKTEYLISLWLAHTLFLTVERIFLYCSNGQEVAVVYFRAGYTPVDYPSESVSDQFVFASHS